MVKTVYFVSDLHLGLESKERESIKENLFVNFLEDISSQSGVLYIVGDLFDYWFEYRRVIQKGFFKVFTSLKKLTENGWEIHYIIGNHDFMHRDFFEKEIGVKLYPDPVEKEIFGKKFFIGHGDGLIKNDLGYKILKKILRNKFLQWIFSFVHPDLGIWIASSSSKKSRDYTSQKNYGESDSLFDVAKEKISDGFDYVIFGHSHRRRFEKYQNGYYMNLGSWLEKPCYAKFDGENLELIELKN
ncbi:MAG: UDP-2,3-diacylglucosamine diphosphatase [Ignavibacteria bacterium]|nr:MAG: UDP-2,3-diacylglucosamine diphosphatase [Ignavibacteria bacterium]